MDSVAEAINHLLHEVEALRVDLVMTRFRLEQAEALRRFDRAKVSVADLRRHEDDLGFQNVTFAR